MSARGSWADDLSITRGRHNFKMGVYIEYDKKTEPGSADYVGNYNFSNDTNNPLNTGNGYANMLLGAFSSYTELTARVDKDVRHWQNDFYMQDNWRVTSRITLDQGIRVSRTAARTTRSTTTTRDSSRTLEQEPGRARCTAWPAPRESRATRPARQPTSGPSIPPIRPRSSRPPLPATWCPGRGRRSTGSRRKGYLGESRHLLPLPVPGVCAPVRVCVET